MGGGKKRKGETFEDVLARPWCYYCERDFDDRKVLIEHQKARHFHCIVGNCNRRLNTIGGLKVHMSQVHKEELTEVPNALDGRKDPSIELFGDVGIPEHIAEARVARVSQEYFKRVAEYRARTGNPLPGTVSKEEASAPKKREEDLQSLKARAQEAKRKAQERKQAAARQKALDEGLPDPFPNASAVASNGTPSHIKAESNIKAEPNDDGPEAKKIKLEPGTEEEAKIKTEPGLEQGHSSTPSATFDKPYAMPRAQLFSQYGIPPVQHMSQFPQQTYTQQAFSLPAFPQQAFPQQPFPQQPFPQQPFPQQPVYGGVPPPYQQHSLYQQMPAYQPPPTFQSPMGFQPQPMAYTPPQYGNGYGHSPVPPANLPQKSQFGLPSFPNSLPAKPSQSPAAPPPASTFNQADLDRLMDEASALAASQSKPTDAQAAPFEAAPIEAAPKEAATSAVGSTEPAINAEPPPVETHTTERRSYKILSINWEEAKAAAMRFNPNKAETFVSHNTTDNVTGPVGGEMDTV